MKNISVAAKMVVASACFILLLLLVRVSITRQWMYFFYAWNLFLAFVPLAISHWLAKRRVFNWFSWLALLSWLLFLPNAPYVITDIFHFEKRPPVPLWFDLLIVTHAAWCGLLAGMVSLLQVEQWLQKHWPPVASRLLISISLVLCGYGIYLGRYGRFNSWDVLTQPQQLLHTCLGHLAHPFSHKPVWAFSLLFGASMLLIYHTMLSVGKLLQRGQ
jgi:uncharacterized membrane protein